MKVLTRKHCIFMAKLAIWGHFDKEKTLNWIKSDYPNHGDVLVDDIVNAVYALPEDELLAQFKCMDDSISAAKDGNGINKDDKGIDDADRVVIAAMKVISKDIKL